MKTGIDNIEVEDMRNGFFYDKVSKRYYCLFCDKHYEDGDVYVFGKRMVTAEKAVCLHIEEKHGKVFENLLSMDKSQTGLTDIQKEFLRNSYLGMSDKEIAEKMGITASTVRYQRFNFREKVKQSRLILALNELFEEKEKTAKLQPPNEEEIMLDDLFSSVSPLVLKTFYFKKNKMKKQLFVLETIVKQFEKGRAYSENEVSTRLKEIYDDHAALRRGLIDNGLMKRTDDGREYWVK